MHQLWRVKKTHIKFRFPLCYLVRQIQHAQVCLYFEAEGGEAGDAVLWSGELMEDDGIFRVQLLLLSRERKQKKKKNVIRINTIVFRLFNQLF